MKRSLRVLNALYFSGQLECLKMFLVSRSNFSQEYSKIINCFINDVELPYIVFKHFELLVGGLAV